MKAIIVLLITVVCLCRGSPYHPYFYGFNPHAAFNWYNPFVAPAPQVPFSGTYSYHDGHKPTVVQANNDGYKFPPAVVAALQAAGPTVVQAIHAGPPVISVPPPVIPVAPPVPFSGTYSYHDGHRPTVVQANNEGYKFPTAASKLYSSWSHPWNPWSRVAAVSAAYHVPPPQKTIVQANLGSVDPWKYGAYYGTGIYGYGFSNYVPGPVAPFVFG